MPPSMAGRAGGGKRAVDDVRNPVGPGPAGDRARPDSPTGKDRRPIHFTEADFVSWEAGFVSGGCPTPGETKPAGTRSVPQVELDHPLDVERPGAGHRDADPEVQGRRPEPDLHPLG